MIGAAVLALSILVLGTASSAHAWQPENPPPCRVEPGPELPCLPGNLATHFHGTASYSVSLSAATQSATGVPGDPGASGTSSITFDLTTNRVCATTTWSGVDSPVVAGHIHGGAYGQPENPGVFISLFKADFVNGRASGASGCDTVPAPLLRQIIKCPRNYNVVVHSQKHAVGALRGQMGTACSV